jgi:hypothetical protein
VTPSAFCAAAVTSSVCVFCVISLFLRVPSFAFLWAAARMMAILRGAKATLYQQKARVVAGFFGVAAV